MPHKEQEVEMHQGDKKVLNVTVEDEDGNAFNLGSVTDFEYAIYERHGSTLAVEKDLSDGITIVDAANGRADITLEPSDTQNISGKFIHEAEITDASGDPATVFTGTIRIFQSSI